jgi:hypothetical protein
VTEVFLTDLGYVPAYVTDARGWRPRLRARHDLGFIMA